MKCLSSGGVLSGFSEVMWRFTVGNGLRREALRRVDVGDHDVVWYRRWSPGE